MSNPKSFSIQGKGLKFDTRAHIEPYLKQIEAIDAIEEIHLGGNTFGTEPCVALAETLKGIDTLKVKIHPYSTLERFQMT